jgi:hypothetical protein
VDEESEDECPIAAQERQAMMQAELQRRLTQ